MEWITQDKNHNPIRHINTGDVKLTEDEAYSKAEQGVLSAFKNTSNPCLTKILAEVRKSLKIAYSKPKIDR